ncbi:SymE family type I addiction module toxin [Photorhabdus luminescens]|uniref:Type I toxin-antitoxin system SymE family toxin n=1 Tax=Photorhabdus luminescens subsp. mexicana TaxID=2100167 RepID=A0A4R4IXU2_PHOLU|nr:SymE family type I addiction module toxin [Photorhabdus luminescens]TDB45465.1 type I toxin-antitoxin system SymE family toxin [Photorhabdus luminescens subsp. mexicana]TDB45471.1 type I toxin-antitoxin system SymE family toxin [Photorhabdus luminescens subsp. mexicana]
MAKAHSKAEVVVNKAVKTERYYTVGYVPNGNKVNNATPAIHLKGQWLRQAGFNTGGQITVKVMDGCLVLIPDSDATQHYQQQCQRQRSQLNEIKLRMREMLAEYNAG